MNMQTNAAALDIIKRFEGLELEAYLCPADVWTIGYGHTGADVKPGRKITEAEAEDILRKDLRKFEDSVESMIKVDVNENEFGACVSLTYNIGPGNFQSSTVLRKLNAGERAAAADAFEMWNKATVNGEKVVLEGLKRRRAAEKGLFLTPAAGSPTKIVKTVDATPEEDKDHPAAKGETAPAPQTAATKVVLESGDDDMSMELPTGAAVAGGAGAVAVVAGGASEADIEADPGPIKNAIAWAKENSDTILMVVGAVILIYSVYVIVRRINHWRKREAKVAAYDEETPTKNSARVVEPTTNGNKPGRLTGLMGTGALGSGAAGLGAINELGVRTDNEHVGPVLQMIQDHPNRILIILGVAMAGFMGYQFFNSANATRLKTLAKKKPARRVFSKVTTLTNKVKP